MIRNLCYVAIGIFLNCSTIEGENEPLRLNNIDAMQQSIDPCRANFYPSEGGSIGGVTSEYSYKLKWDANCKTADGRNLLPNCACWNFNPQSTCSLKVQSKMIFSADEFTSLNAESITTTTEHGGLFRHSSSSETKDYMEIQKWTDEEQNIILHGVADCVVYRLHCGELSNSTVELNPKLKSILANAPIDNQKNATKYYDKELNPSFGKGTFNGIEAGARIGQRVFLTREAMEELQGKGFSDNKAMQESFDAAIVAKGGAGSGKTVQIAEQGAKLEAKSNKIVSFSIGEPPIHGISWMDLVAGRSAMIRGNFYPNCEFYDFFEKTPEMVTRKKYCYNWYLQSCTSRPPNPVVTEEYKVKINSADTKVQKMIPTVDGFCFPTTSRTGTRDSFYVPGFCRISVGDKEPDGFKYWYLTGGMEKSPLAHSFVECGARCLVNTTWYSFDNVTAPVKLSAGPSPSWKAGNIADKVSDICILSEMVHNLGEGEYCKVWVNTAWALRANSTKSVVSCGSYCVTVGHHAERQWFTTSGNYRNPAVPLSVKMWKTSRGFCLLSQAQSMSGTCSIQEVEIPGLVGKYWAMTAGCNDNGSEPVCATCTAMCQSFTRK